MRFTLFKGQSKGNKTHLFKNILSGASAAVENDIYPADDFYTAVSN